MERRSVTSRYHSLNFWITTNRELKQNDDGNGNENSEKSDMFMSISKTILLVRRAFLYIS